MSNSNQGTSGLNLLIPRKSYSSASLAVPKVQPNIRFTRSNVELICLVTSNAASS